MTPDERIRAAAIEAEGADWELLDEEGRADAIDHAATVIRVYLDPSPETVERVLWLVGCAVKGDNPEVVVREIFAALVAPQDTGGDE